MCKLRFSQDVFKFNNAVGCAEEPGASFAVAKPDNAGRDLQPRPQGFLSFPRSCVTAIKLSVYRNAKLQLGWQIADAKLELGVPSRADFTLNLMAVTLCVGMPKETLQRQRYRTAGAVKAAFPRGSAHRYTQVLGGPSFRHGCRNPASKDGKLWDTTDALVSTEGKLRFGKSLGSST